MGCKRPWHCRYHSFTARVAYAAAGSLGMPNFVSMQQQQQHLANHADAHEIAVRCTKHNPG